MMHHFYSSRTCIDDKIRVHVNICSCDLLFFHVNHGDIHVKMGPPRPRNTLAGDWEAIARCQYVVFLVDFLAHIHVTCISHKN